MATGGLTKIYCPAGSNERVGSLNIQLDIIFVHGLNPKASHNHGRQTWTHKNKIFWPGEILPNLLPKARVLLFEYNSQFASFGASTLNGVIESSNNVYLSQPRRAIGEAGSCSSNGSQSERFKNEEYQGQNPWSSILRHSTPGGNSVSVGEVVEKVMKTLSIGGYNSLLQGLKKGESQSLELLWISGLLGYGKTTLASFLITELRKSGHIVLHFFCDNSDTGSGGSLTAIIQSLVLQLAQIQIREHDEVPRVLLRTFRMRKFQTDQQLSGFSWTWSDRWAVLTDMLWQLDAEIKVVICIDALDEWDEETRTARHCISTLLSSLMREQAPPTNTPIKAIVTCRQVDSSMNESYDNDMETVVESKVAKLRQAKGISKRNARKLEESILQHFKGMFLWVSLTTSQLQTTRFGSDIIGSMFLPLGPNQLYQTILEESDVSRVEDTRLIHSVIACSTRPLKFQELLPLLESYCGSRWDGVRGDLGFLCGPLVAIHDNDVLHLAHESLRTFLTSVIDGIGLSFIPPKALRKGTVEKNELPIENRCPSRELSTPRVFIWLLEPSHELNRPGPVYQMSYYLRLPISRDIPWLPEQLDPLHLASFFGITWLVKLLLNDNVMSIRLDEGANPHFQEKQGWTALHWTASNGQLPAAGLLVAMGVNVLLKDSRGYDAEHYAAKSGNWAVVSLLRRKVRQLVHQGLTNYESYSGSDSDVVQSAAQRLSNLKLDSADLEEETQDQQHQVTLKVSSLG
ncbi:hypothetical protein BKA65DRAFT_552026 [Rhexocercosporidium sp. MPI-PUGE-AT-0058]|nr:hypothetical protein BKA65DRAFT_552026 [Rhexocercosporidium sp. MPI-PUGE-AT-0058]